jgi:hypothetical protein
MIVEVVFGEDGIRRIKIRGGLTAASSDKSDHKQTV